MASLEGTDLGAIQMERQVKDTGLTEMPIPASDSADAFLLDLFGVIRRITIRGIKTGTTSQVETFIEAIETITNGSQSASAFVSSLIASPSSINVFVRNFAWEYVPGAVGKVAYTLELTQGS